MKLLEKRRWKTVRAQWKHRKRIVQASRILKQKARLRKESGLYFYHRTSTIAFRIEQPGAIRH